MQLLVCHLTTYRLRCQAHTLTPCGYAAYMQARHAGGAVYVSMAQALIQASMFRNNTASENGGAVAVDSESALGVANSMFTNNHAGCAGGAVYAKQYEQKERLLALGFTGFYDNTAGVVITCPHQVTFPLNRRSASQMLHAGDQSMLAFAASAQLCWQYTSAVHVHTFRHIATHVCIPATAAFRFVKQNTTACICRVLVLCRFS